MSQTTTSPAEMYEQFFVPALFKPWASVLIEQAAPRAGERVLDLACGTGIVTRAVAPRIGPTGRIVGLDLSPDMLAADPTSRAALIEVSRDASSDLLERYRDGDGLTFPWSAHVAKAYA